MAITLSKYIVQDAVHIVCPQTLLAISMVWLLI